MSESLMTIPLANISPNPDQPRKQFDEDALDELAASIRQHGVLEPIVVTPRNGGYMIIAGERRFRASGRAGVLDIPARVIEADDALVEELALIENVQREDLNAIEEARAYQDLKKRGLTNKQVADKVGFRERRIEDRLRLLNLAPEFQTMVVDGTLQLGCSTRGLSTLASGAVYMSRVSEDRQRLIFRKIQSGELNTQAKLRAFIEALESADRQENLFAFTEVTIEEKKSIDNLEALLKTIERLLAGAVTDENLKKAALHSTITPDRIEFIIEQLFRVRKLVAVGTGVKIAIESEQQ